MTSFVFVLHSLDLLFLNMCSTRASLQRIISNLFVCCSLYIFLPLISCVQIFYNCINDSNVICPPSTHTFWYCTWPLLMMVVMSLKKIVQKKCIFLCTVTPLTFIIIYTLLYISCACNWLQHTGPVVFFDQIVKLSQNQRFFKTGPTHVSILLQICECDYTARLQMFHFDPKCYFIHILWM